MSKPRSRFGFRPDIEGLRAFAVLGVLVFHAGVPHLAGGFAGVDVFYVISGFLITGLMFKELDETRRVNIGAFYARRCRRILPSASIVMVATVIASWLIMNPVAVHNMAVDALYAAVYVANWHFIAEGTNYLAISTTKSPFLHYWSLAVEEQFYLVWPFVAIAGAFLARRLHLSLAVVLSTILAAAFAVSFIYSLHLTHYEPTIAYLSTPARVWQFAAGALLAIFVQTGWFAHHGHRFGLLASPLGFAGLVAMVGSFLVFGRTTPYPGTAALLPTLGTAAIIFAGAVPHRGPRVGWLLALPPVRFIGRLSFAWYLTHWPVLVLAQTLDPRLTWQLSALLVLGSAIPAYLVMVAVERPIRLSVTISKRTSSGISVGMLATACAVTASLVAGTQAIDLLGGVAFGADLPALKSVFGKGRGPTHGAVTPNPLNAVADRPYPDACIAPATGTAIPTGSECEFGPAGGKKVVLYGDSHAQQWQPALQVLAAKLNWRIYTITKAGCPTPVLAPSVVGAGSEGSMPECAEFRRNELSRIVNQIHPALIITSTLDRYTQNQPVLLAGWNATLSVMREAHVPIVYIADTPFPDFDVPACMSGALGDWAKCAFARAPAEWQDPVVVSHVAGGEPDVYPVDLNNYICPDTKCPAARDHVLFYRDDSHITATLSRLLAPALKADMVAVKAITSTGAIR